jgi:hypothetical protein
MRTFFLASLALLAVPGHAATRNYGVEGFDRIRVDGPFKVKLTTGVAPFAKASGSAMALDRVALDLQGRTLVVHVNQSSWGGYPGAAAGPVEIALGTHELSGAAVNGSGSLEISRITGLKFDLAVQGSGDATVGASDVDQLRITLLGNASSTVSGRAATLTAFQRGTTALNAAGLTIKDATIGAEGGSTTSAAVTNSAKITASGSATVTLTGNPACTVRANGSASVSGCH